MKYVSCQRKQEQNKDRVHSITYNILNEKETNLSARLQLLEKTVQGSQEKSIGTVDNLVKELGHHYLYHHFLLDLYPPWACQQQTRSIYSCGSFVMC